VVDRARRHELLPHTADVGLRAEAASLPALFEEAAAALGELAADGVGEVGADVFTVPVVRTAADLAGLAYAWLDELIGLAEIRAAAFVDASVAAIEETHDGWRLRAVARFSPYGGSVRPRLGVKSPTYHRLSVEPAAGRGWTLVAYLDV
jgi:SHS2 domain-containing protein